MSDEPKYLRLPALAEYRSEAAIRRSRAFTDKPDRVLGFIVQPLTPKTYSILFADQSKFLFGGQPTQDDVLDYLWVHSPLFVFTDDRKWAKRKRKALASFSRLLRQPWRTWLGLAPDPDFFVATMALAIVDINAIIDDAFADAPGVTKNASVPLASLHAHFVHEFSMAYGWTREQTENTPLKQLFQLYRCICQSRGIDVRDRKEDAIVAAHLKIRKEKLDAEKKEKVNTHG